jgi:hypothetical protein
MSNYEPTDLDYFNFRDHMADDIRRGHVETTPKALFDRARDCAGVEYAVAAEWADRFIQGLNHHVTMNEPTPLTKAIAAAAPSLALGNLSIDTDYLAFRDCLAADLQRGRVAIEPEACIAYAQTCAGIDRATAVNWVEQFCADVVSDAEPGFHE